MSYIEKKVLTPNDEVLMKIKRHPLKIILAWVWGVLGFWLLLIPTLKAIEKTIIFCSSECVMTSKKIIEKHGWIKIHCNEKMIDTIENVTMNQNWFGRIFHYGDICFQGTNRNNINCYSVKNPDLIREKFFSLKKR